MKKRYAVAALLLSGALIHRLTQRAKVAPSQAQPSSARPTPQPKPTPINSPLPTTLVESYRTQLARMLVEFRPDQTLDVVHFIECRDVTYVHSLSAELSGMGYRLEAHEEPLMIKIGHREEANLDALLAHVLRLAELATLTSVLYQGWVIKETLEKDLL
jgi:hypothetical protein